MHRVEIRESKSEFYPPRAPWWSALFHPWFRLQRVLHLENLCLPRGVSLPAALLSFIVPGFAFHALGKRIYGLLIFAGCCLAALVFVVALGWPASGIALGLMIAAHAVGVFLLVLKWTGQLARQERVTLALLSLLAVGLAVYLPAITLLERHCFMPLRAAGRLIIVSPGVNPDSLRRGDLAAFRIPSTGWAGGGVHMQGGLILGPVLAIGGEQGVPEKHWLLRAEFDRHYTHSGSGGGMVEQDMIVSRDQFVGCPFKWWFWRKQAFP